MELTSEEVTSKEKTGVYLQIMSGTSAKVRNALTRVEADAMVRALPELPKIAKPQYNRM